MLDVTVVYILKTWGFFIFALFIAGELLVLLIDLVFGMFEEKKSRENNTWEKKNNDEQN